MVYKLQKTANVVIHCQGAGGPPQAFTAQRGPKELLNHGLEGALLGAGFKQVEIVSVFENGFFSIAEEVSSNLVQALQLPSGTSYADVIGFPFNYPQGASKALSLNLYDSVTKVKIPLKQTVEDIVPIDHVKVMLDNHGKHEHWPLKEVIHNLELLRIFHTADYLKCLDTLARSGFLIHFGGTHDSDIGAVAAVAHYAHLKGKKVCLVSFDAHGDYNTPLTSPSGNLHGMHNTIATGRMIWEGYFAFLGSQSLNYPEIKVKPHNLLHVGGRAFDPLEALLMNQDGINVFAMPQIRKAKNFAEEFAGRYYAAMRGVDAVAVSLDFDVLPIESEGQYSKLAVTCKENGGLQPEKLKTAFKVIAKGELPVIALLGSELNPTAGDEESFDVAVEIIGDFLTSLVKYGKAGVRGW